MTYKVVVSFDFQEKHPWATFGAQIDNIDDVKKLVAESPIELPHIAEITRTINIIDLDKNAKNSLFKRNAIDGHPIVSSLDGGKFLFVFPNILYSDDIKKYLIKKYGSVLNFEENLSKTPLLFDVFEHNSVGLRDSKTGMPTYQKRHFVSWNIVTNNHTIVDRNMNQIWPLDENVGKIPVGLIKLLSKKTEKIK